MIGERLADIRKDHGDTQADLARKLNVSLGTVRAWEQNRNEPSNETLCSICRLYTVSSDFLLGISNRDPLLIDRVSRSELKEEQEAMLKELVRFFLSKNNKE